ncbi:MAG: tetratricopeptide repeat protein, partial [Gammaproteobacteria bacterium]|nr:tetratricopeptide repeat protein [Gammaproteobacteria bacterium]
MNQQDSFENAFRQARELHKAGRLDEAERAYMALAQPGAERRELVLQALAELYMQTRRVGQLVDAMVALTEEAPDNFTYSAQLATLLDRLGHTEAAIDEYHRLISRQPDHAVAQFNLALLYKRALRYRDALSAYEEALRLGIDRLSEVYSNMGVVCTEMRDPVRARKMYEQALEHDSAYIPALFNLAGLHEEAGDRDEATRLYEKILNLDPAHGEALARLAYAAGSESESEQLVARLTAATGEPGDATLTREGLYFALGKLHDQLGAYEQAANAYTEANALGKSRLPPYQRDSIESSIGELMDLYDKEWIEQFAGESNASPVFVCGMFRSGSTLVERMLGAHSAITAGGELDFLPWLIA